MRLQDKKQVAASLASQRKVDIDKGIALATKVDAVRSTLSQEERNLENFRKHAVAQVQTDIDTKLRYKATLEAEIDTLEEERRVLREPLDKEWNTLGVVKARFTAKEVTLSKKSFDLEQKLAEVDRELVQLEAEKGRATDMTHRAAQKLAEAQSTLDGAHESSADMRNKAQVVLSNAELKKQEVDKKELEIDNRAKIVGMKDKELTTRELAVIAGEKRVRDGYATLLRTTKRLHG